MKKLKVVDLFSGAGGLSRGFLDAGYEVLYGIDHDEAALRTFQNNHGNAKALKLDLYNHENIEYFRNLFFQDHDHLDVLVGGPPCQGFSLAGKREEDDERNSLYLSMVKMAKMLKPRAIVLENVPGLLTLYEGKAMKRIIDDFEQLGYSMSVKILHAVDYGIPQIRKRAFFVGLLGTDAIFKYPEPLLENRNYITCKQAISDLPSLINDEDYSLETVRSYRCEALNPYQMEMRKDSEVVYNHYPTRHTQKTINHIALVPDGGKYLDLPSHLAKNFKYKESLHRYNSNKPSLTIDTGHRTHFHYEYNRIPTVRENARLQSFPDDFVFYGSKQQQYKQVGNAVPPLLGKIIALKLKEYITYE